MAYALRAFYEQGNNFGVTDRIEIREDDFVGTTIELTGRAPLAFDFEHRELSNSGEYISIYDNPIIMGVLDFYLRTDTTAKENLVTDIADSIPRQFQLRWLRDDELCWIGYPNERIVNYPDTINYNVKIQFRDFEYLKGKDFPLENIRQKLEVSLRDFSNDITDFALSASFPMRTATSWECEGTTVADDFLNQVYHNTFPLRQYREGGLPSDQIINQYEALKRCLEPQLIMYQWRGINLYQISALKNPSSVQVANYGLIGQLSRSNVDLRQTIYTSEALGTPSAKRTTQNTSFPPLHRASYTFNHNSGSSVFEFLIDETISYRQQVDFEGNFGSVTPLDFSGDGDEVIRFIGNYDTTVFEGLAEYAIHIEEYALDSDLTFQTMPNYSNVGSVIDGAQVDGEIPMVSTIGYKVGDPVMMNYVSGALGNFLLDRVYYVIEKNDIGSWIKLSEEPDGAVFDAGVYAIGNNRLNVIKLSTATDFLGSTNRAVVDFTSGAIPSSVDELIEIILLKDTDAIASASAWYNMDVIIQNPSQAGAKIEYRLTQSNEYSDELTLPESYFGDGVYAYSNSSYRTSTATNDITTGWRIRGETPYIPYSNLRLREILDYQRFRQLKKQFELWGEFEPHLVSVYQSENFMYIGGRYDGRWKPVCVRIEENLDA